MDEEQLILLGELKAWMEQMKADYVKLLERIESLEARQQWTTDDISNVYREAFQAQEAAAAAIDAVETLETEIEASAEPETETEETTSSADTKTFDDSKVEKTTQEEKNEKKRKRRFAF